MSDFPDDLTVGDAFRRWRESQAEQFESRMASYIKSHQTEELIVVTPDDSLDRVQQAHSACLDWICETVPALDKTGDNAIAIAQVVKLLTDSLKNWDW